MRILIVTKEPNGILDYLQGRKDVTLKVVNCEDDKGMVLMAIRGILGTDDIDMIFTYRCPIILPSEIYLNAKFGAFNIQPSLIPQYPVINPWTAICKNHDKKSGVTLHKIDSGVCTGTIITQRDFDVYSVRGESWYYEIIEKLACLLLDDIIFAFDYKRESILQTAVINSDGSNLFDVSVIAKRFLSSGYIYGKLEMKDESFKDYERAKGLYESLSSYYEAKEQYKNALTQQVFVLLLCLKAYGQKHEQTALCYEHAAELQAKLGMEEKAMNSQRMANEIRERLYGFNHERYIQGLQKFGEIGFLIGEYKRKQKGKA